MSDVAQLTGSALDAALDGMAADRLRAMTTEIARDPARVRVLHPAAARMVGRGALDPADPTGTCGPTLEDAVRAVLVGALGRALRPDRSRLVAEVQDLYRFGDADEKRAVLRALPLVDVGDEALPLVADALRTNDVRLVAAALGPYGAAHLDDETWRHGVLKCLFVGVPLAAVDRLADRTDVALARMVASYCHERVAAGRDVPGDVWLVLDRYAEVLDETPLRRELRSEYPDRRAAAERLLAGRGAPSTVADDKEA